LRSPERAATPLHPHAPRAGTLRVFGRYLVFQVPGWIIVGAALMAAIRWWQVAEPVAWLLLALFVTKDLVLFPLVRKAYEPSSGVGVRALVGCSAIARDALTPSGYVSVGSELWRAELREGGSAPAGSGLRVVELNGMTLIVDLVEEEPSP
jgi:membrane protein implicated in regulation of membrane protease activity